MQKIKVTNLDKLRNQNEKFKAMENFLKPFLQQILLTNIDIWIDCAELESISTNSNQFTAIKTSSGTIVALDLTHYLESESIFGYFSLVTDIIENLSENEARKENIRLIGAIDDFSKFYLKKCWLKDLNRREVSAKPIVVAIANDININ